MRMKIAKLGDQPEEEQLETIIEDYTKEADNAIKRAARLRIRKAKEKEKEDWRRGGRKRYAWIKGRPRSVIGAVRTSEGEVVAEPTEMAEHIAKAWQAIYEEPSGVDVEDFLQTFKDYICKGPKQKARRLRIRK